MAEVWGLMPKSQVDNQTIEEAIAAAIVDHESDEEAHLGAGESLAAHKSYEKIDHPAGSVVSDKVGMFDFSWSTDFSDLSRMTVVGDYYAGGVQGLELNADPGGVNPAYLKMIGAFINTTPNYQVNFFFQTFYANNPEDDDDHDVFIGMTDMSGGLPVQGLGFAFIDNAIKGWYRFGGAVVYIDFEIEDDHSLNSLRFLYDKDTRMGYWYINGDEVGSFDFSAIDFYWSNYFYYYITATGSNVVYGTIAKFWSGIGY